MTQPGWYPDPSGSPGQRYWDGATWGPVAPAPPAAPVAPPKRKVWPWVVIGVVILLFGGCATMCASIASNVGSSSDRKGSNSATKPTAGIGQEVRDGKFAFVVKSVDTQKTGTGLAKPRGEFVVVTMSITNSGDEPQSFFAGNQKLIDTAGREYASDTMAALSMNDDSMAIDLNPGFTLNVKVPFDVPPGTQPSAVVLHDSAFSGGAKVSLG